MNMEIKISQTNSNPQESQEALNGWKAILEIENIQKKTRQVIASSRASAILMLWGAVWFFAFLYCWYLPSKEGLIWTVFDCIGIAGTIFLVILGKRKVRAKNPLSKKLGWRMFWFWFLLLVYGGVFMTALWTDRGFQSSQIAAFICALVMFAYVIIGLWFDANFLLWLGLAVTALVVVGYLFLNSFFNLWMAPAGGGALFLTGLYIQLKWRQI
jgi:hypothetical protein